MRILIADDDEVLRELLTDLLASKGHTVLAARDGADALRGFTELGDFDYVITDYQMPRKNGVVLIMDIRRAKPDQKCILVSGDPPQITDIIRKEAGEFPILRKPYRNAELLDLLK
jgi:two-component system nitrogen regulation response regulator GlnG